MSWNSSRLLEGPASNAPAVNNFLAMLSRQRRPAAIAFVLILGAMTVFGLLLSDRYEARMEILVEQAQLRRADPVITGGANPQPIVTGTTSDETLNSEIALLRSQDVLQQVVIACGLDSKTSSWDRMIQSTWKKATDRHIDGWLEPVAKVIPIFRRPTQRTREERTVKAIRTLAAKLRVEVVKMSYVISVAYRSSDPQLAAQVLQTLGDVYLKEHALAHHPPGELRFFQEETDQARAKMDTAEQDLVKFTKTGGVASGQVEMEDALRRLSGVQALETEMRASIAGTISRIRSLEGQAGVLPQRQVTALKTSDSAILLQQLKSSLLDLEMKRTELLTKFQPTYPLVVEVDQKIAQARAALADAQRSQVQETTTDRDPSYELVREDLSRSNAELATLEARSTELETEAAADRAKARWLQEATVTQHNLVRTAKAAEDNYLLLLRKEEEARISAQLDRGNFFNVSIVQAASNPLLPVHSAPWYLINGCLLGILCAFAAAAGADRLDPTLRTPEEVELMLHAPVLAVLPLSAMGLSRLMADHRTGSHTRVTSL
jgi:uncharacterized protein involved in exopolysaccharide biosynthesis